MPTHLGRLTRPEDFAAILKNGSHIYYRGLTIAFRLSSCGTRIGFAVGRAAGNAVQRNRFRRIVRECLRSHALPPSDMVIISRGAICNMGNDEIRRRVETLLYKNGWLS